MDRFAAEHPGHDAAEYDEERRNVDGVGIRPAVGDSVSRAHSQKQRFRCQEEQRCQHDAYQRSQHDPLGRRPVGIPMVPLADVPGYGGSHTDAQPVADADKDRVDRVDDAKGAHGGTAESRYPEAVHDIVELLEEEGDP